MQGAKPYTQKPLNNESVRFAEKLEPYEVFTGLWVVIGLEVRLISFFRPIPGCHILIIVKQKEC